MGYLDHVQIANNARLEQFAPLTHQGTRYGWVRRDRLDILKSWPDAFQVLAHHVEIADHNGDMAARNQALDGAAHGLAEAGEITGWRGELYPIAARFNGAPVALVERAMASFLGIRAWGGHMNGYVRKEDGLHMWVARRAFDKPTYPGQLDNMVAGGQPHGINCLDNMIKECWEEAGIPEAIAGNMIATGAIAYTHQWEPGLKPDEMFTFDLELPEVFQPRNTDGEVAEFTLLPIEEVMRLVRDTTEFKYNCNLCIIDFLIRHGLLTPDNEPDYMDLCRGLRGIGE